MKIFNFISDFFSDVGNFLKSRSVLGIDIGTASIKIAELTEKKEHLVLANYGLLEAREYLIHPNRVIQSSSLKISESESSVMLKTLLREMKISSRVAVASIPAFSAFTTTLDMPILSVEETKKAVQFQAPQYIPLPMNEVALDWMKVGEFEDATERERHQRIFLIGIPREIIEKYRTIFRMAGLKLAFLEIDGLAIVRSSPESVAGDFIVVDLGAESSNIFGVSGGQLIYASQTDYGGVYLTQAIARSLGVSVMRAEELKRRRGLLTGGAESELSTLTQPFLDVIIQEANHVRDVCERRYGMKIDKALLLGSGANLLGLDGYFEREAGLKVAHPNIFRKLDYDLKLEPLARQLNNELPIAAGLAERYFSQ